MPQIRCRFGAGLGSRGGGGGEWRLRAFTSARVSGSLNSDGLRLCCGCPCKKPLEDEVRYFAVFVLFFF